MFSDLKNIFGGAIALKKTGINYDSYIAQLNAQKERQALLPDNVTLGGSNATLLGYELFNDNIFTRYTIKYQFAYNNSTNNNSNMTLRIGISNAFN